MTTVVGIRSSLPSASKPVDHLDFVELGLLDAVEPFKRLRSQSADELQLYCTVPTWSTSSDNCLDLDDFQQLRSKVLTLVKSLRSSGIASYVLVPSSSSRCIVCVRRCPDLSSAVDTLQKITLPVHNRQNVLLADLGGGPCLVII
ncbi:hypothetical protein R3P38DRAFT_31425 [Favolaschia claudopus]|uniref:Uncharacterized protein n=1 Tax=Favolaschia claudopus TaxID=2862362 RepID=A0AAW0EFH7_9AGAR